MKVTDADGNEIARGMAVVSGGDSWVVGYASPAMIRLDRLRPDGRNESRMLGRRCWYCIHVIGFTLPLIFK